MMVWPSYGPEYGPAIAWLWRVWGVSCLVSLAGAVVAWRHRGR